MSIQPAKKVNIHDGRINEPDSLLHGCPCWVVDYTIDGDGWANYGVFIKECEAVKAKAGLLDRGPVNDWAEHYILAGRAYARIPTCTSFKPFVYQYGQTQAIIRPMWVVIGTDAQMAMEIEIDHGRGEVEKRIDPVDDKTRDYVMNTAIELCKQDGQDPKRAEISVYYGAAYWGIIK